jgi:hypothetical protein
MQNTFSMTSATEQKFTNLSTEFKNKPKLEWNILKF